jgi:Spy/CpxP family protein refolding chaperone
MASRTAWLLAAALVSATPVSAASPPCDQASAQKPEPGARGADNRPPDSRGGTDGKGGRDNNKDKDGRDPHRVPWWIAADTRADLGITDKQSKDIDDIFQATLPSLRAAKEELDKLDDAVASLIKEGTADIAVVARQVGQAEQARANLTTKRTVMLYRMHRLLTPEQRTKLDAMFARREAERRKNDPNGRR